MDVKWRWTYDGNVFIETKFFRLEEALTECAKTLLSGGTVDEAQAVLSDVLSQ